MMIVWILGVKNVWVERNDPGNLDKLKKEKRGNKKCDYIIIFWYYIMLAPKLNSYAAGTNSPQSSAYANNQSSSTKLNTLSKIGGTRNYRGGAVTVPIMNTLYQPASSAQSAGSSQVQLAKIGGQTNANAAYDNATPRATFPPPQSGGSGVKWGCYSGGRRRKSTKKRRKVSTKRRKRSRRRL